MQWIMGGSLVGDDIRTGAARPHAGHELRKDVGGIAQEADRFSLTGLRPLGNQGQGFVERPGFFIDVSGAQAKIDACLVTFDGETTGACHDCGQRLGTAHATEATGQDPLSLEVALVMLAACFGKGFVGSLHNALRANVDPGPCGHLAVHHQALLIEVIEMVPGGPMGHEVRVGDEHARRIFVGLDHGNGPPRLDDQGFILVQGLQGGDNLVEVLPTPGGAANAAIDHKLMGILGHIRVKVVHDHAERCFRAPIFGIERRSRRWIDVAGVLAVKVHGFNSNALSAMACRMCFSVRRRCAAFASL